MTAAHAARLVDDYLQRLETELQDLPAARRFEILDEIRGHIAEERTAIPDESDADVMNLLERIGDPMEIAAEARGSEGTPRQAAARSGVGTLEVLALALTLLAWPVGIVLVWISKAWTTREKVLATLVPPGGYPGVLLLMSTFHWFVSMSKGGPAWVRVAVGAVLFTVSLLLITAPIGMCIYLATRLRARPRPEARE